MSKANGRNIYGDEKSPYDLSNRKPTERAILKQDKFYYMERRISDLERRVKALESKFSLRK